ncbi:MAG: DegT/DnrJ/EryC1/StrS family aminotransferase [Candidatus Omnitrophica bacterium]|nr:DegT/DnrJ/EryC1/StrS family aminotransferase [Candidatus Omnitrophota bacterium]
MPIRKIPVAGSNLPLSKILVSLVALITNRKRNFSRLLSEHAGNKQVFFLNSGLACFYLILEVLKLQSEKKEVILPAYTAGSLAVAVKKAGLKPVLCDISLEDFNMDIRLLEKAVSADTLCIVAIHMFGILQKGIERIKAKYPRVYVIEDCAQAMGSKIADENAGNFSDISFFSFNRGKNFTTYGGGAIAVSDEKTALFLREKIMLMEKISFFADFKFFFKTLALSLAVNPYIYGMLYGLIRCFKETKPALAVEVKQYARFQECLGQALFNNINSIASQRHENGVKVIEALREIKDITVPLISAGEIPAFNRLPVLFKNSDQLEKVEKVLADAGIETSRMYFKPLHHMFELGYKIEDFPNAVYLAEHLLTFPTHPLLKDSDIEKIITLIQNTDLRMIKKSEAGVV